MHQSFELEARRIKTMAEDILFSQAFQKAASQLQTRAERLPEDPITLIDSFVDFGIIEQVQNNKNQIIYGRRGTGKTHLLRALATPIARAKGLHCYIDCRTLGSGPIQITDCEDRRDSSSLTLLHTS